MNSSPNWASLAVISFEQKYGYSIEAIPSTPNHAPSQGHGILKLWMNLKSEIFSSRDLSSLLGLQTETILQRNILQAGSI